MSADAVEARPSCGGSAEFTVPPVYFDVERPDPFGRPGRLYGGEAVDPRKGLMLQVSCFQPAKPDRFRPTREEAIQAMFAYTRGLGVFGQDYYVKDTTDRVLILVTGSRTIKGTTYVVKLEHHILARGSMTMLASYRKGDETAARLAQSFFDMARMHSHDAR